LISSTVKNTFATKRIGHTFWHHPVEFFAKSFIHICADWPVVVLYIRLQQSNGTHLNSQVNYILYLIWKWLACW